ncbi:hypothetical protein [Planctomycetes bacterium CA13]
MSTYRDGLWSRDAQLIWTQGKMGESIEIEFSVPADDKYDLLAVFTKAIEYGIFEFAVDGESVDKRVDLYDTEVTTSGEISLGKLTLTKGLHRLKATIVGHNAMSKGGHRTGANLFGLDYVRLAK